MCIIIKLNGQELGIHYATQHDLSHLSDKQEIETWVDTYLPHVRPSERDFIIMDIYERLTNPMPELQGTSFSFRVTNSVTTLKPGRWRLVENDESQQSLPDHDHGIA